MELGAAERALKAEVEAWTPQWAEAAEAVRRRIFAGEGGEIPSDVESKLRSLGYID